MESTKRGRCSSTIAADGMLERFIVVLNFSDATQFVDVPLSTNGGSIDLLNANATVVTQDYKLHNHAILSNWGCLFWQKLLQLVGASARVPPPIERG